MPEKSIKERYEKLSKYLNEKTRRLWCATEAMALGHGGISKVAKITGVSRTTICEGKKELLGKKDSVSKNEKVRRSGGGRQQKKIKEKTLLGDLKALVEPETRGDPESLLKWTTKSTRQLAEALQKKGHKVSHSFVGYTLKKDLEYTLQSNKKTKEGSSNPDRNAQFEMINHKCKQFEDEKCPIISVDTKKKENVGNFKNNGQEYRPKGQPQEVNGHDFPDKELGKVSPYGVYDILQNKGWVSVGISKDTASFAVNAIRTWWVEMGQVDYFGASKLLITADCGGSNSYRTWLWKFELQQLANELNIEIHVCHFPPGTSKWNKIEHRMFSFISKNWRGKPLLDYVTIVNLISNTKTKKGLEIKARLDTNTYKTGIKISKKEMDALNIILDDFHGEWNYKFNPCVD